MTDDDLQAMRAELGSLRAEVGTIRAALSDMGAYVYIKDRDGRYTYANPATCRLFGRRLEEIIGETDAAFFDPRMVELLRANDRKVLAGTPFSGEEAGTSTLTGEERVYWVAKSPMRTDDGEITGVVGISIDITSRKLLERELDAQRKLLDTVLDNVDAYIYMKTKDRRYLYVNKQWADMFGTTVDAAVGRREPDVLPAQIAERFWELDQKVFASQERQAAEEPAVMEDGTVRHFWSVKVPLGHIGEPDALIGFSTDVTELRELREELERQAFTDQLTGVASRRYFLQEARRHVTLAHRYGRPLSLMIMDLDFFKQVNDEHGHAAGDEVLVGVAEACSRAIRGADLIGRIESAELFGRLGGEEFAVLAPDTDLHGAVLVAERLRTLINGLAIPVGGGSATVRLSASIGVAELDLDGSGDDPLRRLLADADRALYAAKDAGRNSVRAAPSAPSTEENSDDH